MVVLELPETVIAVHAEQAAYLTCLVIMVHVQLVAKKPTADATQAALLGNEHRKINAITPVARLVRMRGGPATLTRVNSLAVPLIIASFVRAQPFWVLLRPPCRAFNGATFTLRFRQVFTKAKE